MAKREARSISRGVAASRVAHAGRVLASLLLVVVVLVGNAWGQAPELVIEPDFMYLGSFSTFDALGSDIYAGTSTMSVLSSEPWQVEVVLEGPIHRTMDGLELPLARIADTHPGVPAGVIDLQPYVYESGSGSADWYVMDGDWLELASGLEAYLDPGDPPGTYEVTMVARLLDAGGLPTTDYVTSTLQFDVQPWVSLEDVLPDSYVGVPEGEFVGESPLTVVRIASNTSWSLAVRGTADLIREGDEDEVLPLTNLSVCTESVGGERPWRSGCETVQLDPIVLVVSSEPPPFDVSIVEIPVFVRFEGEPPLPWGRYGTSLVFEATANGY